MGMNVYLYYYGSLEDTIRLEEQVYREVKGLQREFVPDLLHGVHQAKRWEDMTPEERERLQEYDAARERIVRQAGLDDGGAADGRAVERPSKRHPNSQFKIGYWHPGYVTPELLNAVLQTTIGHDLYDAFPPAQSIRDGQVIETRFRPDWHAAREQVVAMLRDFRSPEAAARSREHQNRWPNLLVHNFEVYEGELDVVLETIEHVLSQSDPKCYILDWPPP